MKNAPAGGEMYGHIFELTRKHLESLITAKFGAQSAQTRANRIFEGLYGRGKVPEWQPQFPEQTHLGTLEYLRSGYSFELPMTVSRCETSAMDGSSKLVMTLKDGLEIETVLIPERGRLTQCLSTQVGCAQGCRFCQTGRMGLLRSLTVSEIVGQVVVAELWRRTQQGVVAEYDRATNLVFMGMGEPLDNLQSVLDAIEIFTDTQGLQFSHNKITVSTVGLLPQLDTLLSSAKTCLALSLHSPFDAERSKVMPVNVRHPVADVIALLRSRAESYGRPYMIQYTLLKNVNDTADHAHALAQLLAGLKVKINLIPLNEHEGAAFRRPDLSRLWQFRDILKEHGHVVTVRLSKGRDIAAACGQLIKSGKPAAGLSSDQPM
ncbi:MAG: 23S rRNA (adenine(2503)-C(2))-methyltransferase RlmN [Proteobacteria bacterium]|nr:23S rRNA (adenine(2503)-C(2))-methyltransferase RlmN [Pseudomonadota bacterium]